MVGQVEGVLPGAIEFGDEDRLVDLYPCDALFGQRVQQLRVRRQQDGEQGQLVGTVARLGQCQVGNRADDDGFGLHALCAGFSQLIQQARRVQRERRRSSHFGHDVVVVGIEPLGHFAGGDPGAAGSVGRLATGDAEIIIERVPIETLDARGQVTERDAHVQHLVVERKVAHRDEIEPLLPGPVLLAQQRAQCLQGLARQFAFPVRLQAELQCAPGADAGKTEIVGNGHVLLSLNSGAMLKLLIHEVKWSFFTYP